MNNKLEELISLYQHSNKSKWQYNNTNLILFDDKQEDNYTLSICVYEIDSNYYEFLFIDDKEKLLFKGLLYNTDNKEKLNFEYFKNELNKYTINQIIDKYYDILKENF